MGHDDKDMAQKSKYVLDRASSGFRATQTAAAASLVRGCTPLTTAVVFFYFPVYYPTSNLTYIYSQLPYKKILVCTSIEVYEISIRVTHVHRKNIF